MSTPAPVSRCVLVVDDEPGIRSVLADVLSDEGYDVRTAEDGLQALDRLDREEGASVSHAAGRRPDLVLLDVWLPGMGGIDVLSAIKERSPDLPVVMISGHASIDVAVNAVKMGAFDFLEKPLTLERTTTVVRNALRQTELVRENLHLRRSLLNEDEMIGASDAMALVRERIEQSAAVDATVLISGENGTGKELVAKQIHLGGRRAARQFVEVNCAAIPEALIESELFGHERGAFTGAIARRIGKFEAADGGTLFLDEIGDMSLATQAKILRAIQEMRFTRVGGEAAIEVDVRLLAASNRDLQAEANAGRFRKDLYYRLNVVPVLVPALRDRPEDLEALFAYFAEKFATNTGRAQCVLSPQALGALRQHSWPGNIRELKNFIERVTIMSDNPQISLHDAESYLGVQVIGGEHRADGPIRALTPPGLPLAEARDSFECAYVEEALVGSANLAVAARKLGISVSNLHNKIKKYAIRRPGERSTAAP
jgi:two-component system nitrogen regulation response regulator NtrX